MIRVDLTEAQKAVIRNITRGKEINIRLTKRQKQIGYEGRKEWALRLLDEIKPKGKRVGVEVGLWKGDFAQLMLNADPNLTWWGVDPYFEYGRKKRKQREWDAIFGRVMGKLLPFGKRFRMVRKPSHEGVKYIPKKVDFIFIDGNHDTDVVEEDLRLYEKHVRKGGIMSGHDYVHRVPVAVDRYVAKHGRKMHVETDFDPYGVFWWKMP